MPMSKIAETAWVDSHARIADDARIGHHCYIGPNVVIEPGCVLHNNVTIVGRTTVGRNNTFFQNAVVGTPPQDLKYKGDDTQIVIGDNNVFRENVTVHLGTELGGGVTRVGSHNLFMAGVHLAHDCRLADRIIIANNALIAGHVTLEQSTVIGGGAALHHFVTVGRNAMVGGLTRVVYDVPPFMIFEGNPGSVRAVNVTGLTRNGFDEAQVDAIKAAYKTLYRGGDVRPALDILEQANGDDPNVRHLIEFVRRGFQGRHGRYREAARCDSTNDIGGNVYGSRPPS